MNKTLIQDFKQAEARQKRVFFWLGTSLLFMLLATEGLLLVKGQPLDITLIILFAVAGIGGWWLYTQTRAKLRQQSLTNWHIVDTGLEWTDPMAGHGVFLWNEIVGMTPITGGIRLQCRKAEPDGGQVRECSFWLYVGGETSSELLDQWRNRRSSRLPEFR